MFKEVQSVWICVYLVILKVLFLPITMVDKFLAINWFHQFKISCTPGL